MYTKNVCVWNANGCNCEIEYAYMKSLIDDSLVSCNETIDMVAKSYSHKLS